jgi:hypothetical protein
MAKTVARLGVGRLGDTRLDYAQPWIRVTINGNDETEHIRQAGFSISDARDGEPQTATLKMETDLGSGVLLGKELEIYCGDQDEHHMLFGGFIVSVDQSFEGGDVLTLPVWNVVAAGYQWQLSRKLVLQTWSYETVADILRDIQASYATDWTFTIDAALETVVLDEFAVEEETDVQTCLTRLADRSGASWYARSKPDGAREVRFLITETDDAATPLANTSTGYGHSKLRLRQDATELFSRVWSRGGGSETLVEVPAGANSIPVTDAVWYAATDVLTHEDYTCVPYLRAGTARFQYTGRSLEAYDGKSTTIVPRPEVVPTAPALAQAAQGNAALYEFGAMAAGTYRYRATYTTANGESEASAAGTGVIEELPKPLLVNMEAISGINANGTMVHGAVTEYYQFSVTYSGAGAESAESAAITGLMVVGHNSFTLSNLPISPDARTTRRNIYMSTPTDPVRRLVLQVNDNSTTSAVYLGGYVNASQVAPTAPSGGNGKIQLREWFIGPSGTTERSVYRTKKNGSTFYHLTAVMNNTTQSFLDNTADEMLSNTVLATDVAHAGPGDTQLRVADLGQLPPSGWVQIGTNIVRYAAKSNTEGTGFLTGIPTVGYGAITTTIAPEAPVVFVPSIEGVSNLTQTIRKGSAVNVEWLTSTRFDNNPPDNTDLSFGFPYDVTIADERVSSTEARRRGIAKLTLHNDPVQTVSYETRDQTARVGRIVTVDVGDLIEGEYRIHSVRISREFLPPDSLIHPKRNVEASSKRFTFAGLLAALRRAGR